MRNSVYINGIKVYAYHGCLEEEARTGTDYIIDVRIDMDFSEAAQNDDLLKTADYCVVYDVVKKEMAIRSKLIEQVCHRIFHSLKREIKGIECLNVKVTKLNPPINGPVDSASVEIEG